ncbi:hypothetical protein AcdelDRAFT_0028 [Acidovorax delafieldii 2AN]|jgi:hypothetical protein|uniref:Uncharacterized protein n=1 Tax=Acidovorax delafieldii 2AN TaxID=573060 RepID=C5SZE8_ACIDE|nr:hypothetical protein AcdelDRAFT_0028 [Acidovorax delafieldii 2AN]
MTAALRLKFEMKDVSELIQVCKELVPPVKRVLADAVELKKCWSS